jgi:hypothetical protein
MAASLTQAQRVKRSLLLRRKIRRKTRRKRS